MVHEKFNEFCLCGVQVDDVGIGCSRHVKYGRNGDKTPHEAQFDLIPKFVFPIPGDELFSLFLDAAFFFTECDRNIFFQDRRRNPARVQTERKSEVRAFFRWSRACLLYTSPGGTT